LVKLAPMLFMRGVRVFHCIAGTRFERYIAMVRFFAYANFGHLEDLFS